MAEVAAVADMVVVAGMEEVGATAEGAAAAIVVTAVAVRAAGRPPLVGPGITLSSVAGESEHAKGLVGEA